MPETVFGLPTHAIVVHATVVLLPLAALAVLLYAFWPVARRRLGIVTPVLAGVALVLVPLSNQSGESLERSVGRNPLVDRHASWPTACCPGPLRCSWSGPGSGSRPAGANGRRASA